MKLGYSWQIFEKYWNINFLEKPSGGWRVVPCGEAARQTFRQTDGRTDMTKLPVAFRNLANASENQGGSAKWVKCKVCAIIAWQKDRYWGNISQEEGRKSKINAEDNLARGQGPLCTARMILYIYIYIYIYIYRGPGSSVGIATDYGLEGPGSNTGGDEIFCPSRPTLGPTQPSVKWVPCLSRG